MGWNRRDFVKASALATMAGALPGDVGAQQPAAPVPPVPPVPPVAPTPPPAPALFTPLRRNVGIFNQRGGTIGWLVSGDGLLVIDSQFADTAPNLLIGLKERSPRQIDVLVNSHHHPDHTGGNGVLRPAAKQIVAHVRSSENQKVQAERMKAPTTLPDHTFPDTWSVTIGDETVRARHWGPAHTGGDVSIHFEQANIVHFGRSAQQPRLSQRGRAGRGVGARLDPGAGKDGAGLSRRRALRLWPRRSRLPGSSARAPTCSTSATTSRR